jgi:putative oxidoreductase
MDLVRALARPMLGSMFVYGGLDSLRNAGTKVQRAEKVVGPLSDMVEDTIGDAVGLEAVGLRADTATLVRINGAVQVAAGLALAAGKLPRIAALTLAASLVPTTLAGHRFWEESDPSARAGQRIHFLKNVSMLGGLLIAADDTGGRPSIPWRIHEAVDHARDGLPDAVAHIRPHAIHD